MDGDDLADDIAKLIAPDAPVEIQLAGRMIVEARNSSTTAKATAAALKKQAEELKELADKVEKLANRPTLGTLLRDGLQTRAGQTLATGLATGLVWIALSVISWVTGVVQVPAIDSITIEAPAPVPPTRTP